MDLSADGSLRRGAREPNRLGIELLCVAGPGTLGHMDSLLEGFASKLSGVHQSGSGPVCLLPWACNRFALGVQSVSCEAKRQKSVRRQAPLENGYCSSTSAAGL